MPALRAKGFHGVERGLHHPIARAFPARMRRADHARLGIGKKHRLAIGGQDRQRQARRGRHHRIGAGPVGKGGGDGHHIGRMNLMHADQRLHPQTHRIGDAGAVDGDDLGLIRTASAAIQPGENARRRATLAGEKAMTGRKGIRGNDFQHLRLSGNQAKPGGSGAEGP